MTTRSGPQRPGRAVASLAGPVQTAYTFRYPLAITVLAIVLTAIFGGLHMATIVALLAILEISISFDNAIVNAAVLRTMTEKWQRIFLTWGILIAVFGMRLVFPIVIVAVAASLGPVEVLDLALNDQDTYAAALKDSYPIIASFGGFFLLMVFLDFFIDETKDQHWIGFIERPLARVGHLKSFAAGVGVLMLLIVSQTVSDGVREDVLLAGLAGLVAYLFSSGAAGALEERLEHDLEEAELAVAEERAEMHGDAGGAARRAGVQMAAKGGFASFLYLELLDASFSFDGVIGAFAISTDIIVIAIGLGLGAIYIRTMTVHLVHKGTLSMYRYLESGAHWAIGILALLLFIGMENHVPEVITGSLGGATILASFVASIVANRRDQAQGRSTEIELQI